MIPKMEVILSLDMPYFFFYKTKLMKVFQSKVGKTFKLKEGLLKYLHLYTKSAWARLTDVWSYFLPLDQTPTKIS